MDGAPNSPVRMSSQDVIRRSKAINEIIVKSASINLLEVIHNKKYGFGTIHKALFNNNEVYARNIKFDRLSRYDLEGLQKDLDELA
jgi:hypothetical protein